MGNDTSASELRRDKTKSFMDADSDTLKFGEFDQLFQKFDEDSSGSINEWEFKQTLNHYITIHPEKANKVGELRDQISITDDNELTKDEFRRLMDQCLNPKTDGERIIEAFRVFDKTMTAEITTAEIIHTFNRLGLNITKEDVELMLMEADNSNDGTLDFEEFIKIMLSH